VTRYKTQTCRIKSDPFVGWVPKCWKCSGNLSCQCLGVGTARVRRYEVSSRVNLVKNDDLSCAEPMVRTGAAGVQLQSQYA
jgi:hypothetical protein